MISALRLGTFFGFIVVMGIWEILNPRRRLRDSKLHRWITNFSLTTINVVILQLTIGALAYQSAIYASGKGWGLLNWVNAPTTVAVLVTLFFLDFVIYKQHKYFHEIPFFWRFHKVHHTDLDLDVSSGFRFHPIEIIFSLIIKVVAILIIGAHPLSVVAFEIILASTSEFNHGNVNIPVKLDKILRLVIITPDMHRIHHSVRMSEANSNYGFSISIWDRLLGTYTDQPHAPQTEFTLGVSDKQDPAQLGLINLLMMPFQKKS